MWKCGSVCMGATHPNTTPPANRVTIEYIEVEYVFESKPPAVPADTNIRRQQPVKELP